ncbi:hypothetical protein ACIBTZ_01620 [Micromonospora sp. NPDC049460]|uniref:Uncharacterized protein n=1 Tax=Micromonospora citrea TaxID=47855 RepID=A0A1C6TQS3_9ACTN|nr:hypothetical protein [Micromonospora citrea]SCL44172.1 hypothetical protein GA0070606_0170 [Micromonospora citrea]
MTERPELVEDPIGQLDLTDLDQEINGGSSAVCFTITVTISTFKHSICGTCGIFSVGCC